MIQFERPKEVGDLPTAPTSHVLLHDPQTERQIRVNRQALTHHRIHDTPSAKQALPGSRDAYDELDAVLNVLNGLVYHNHRSTSHGVYSPTEHTNQRLTAVSREHDRQRQMNRCDPRHIQKVL